MFRTLIGLLTMTLLSWAWGMCAAETFNDRVGPLQELHRRSPRHNDRVKAATLVMRARIHERNDELNEAIRLYQRAWRLDRGAFTIIKQVVPLAIRLGRMSEAGRYAALIPASSLEEPFLAEQLAIISAEQQLLDESLQFYERLLELQKSKNVEQPTTIAIHFEMGRLSFLQKRYAEAAKSFRTVLAAVDDPQKSRAEARLLSAILAKPHLVYSLIAECFLESGAHAEAAAMFTKAAETAQERGWSDLQLARVEFGATRYAESWKSLQRYVEQGCNFAGHKPYEMIETLIEHDAITEVPKEDTMEDTVIAFLQQRLTEDSENPSLQSYTANKLLDRGKIKPAIALLESSLAKDPSREAFVGLLLAYHQSKQFGKLLDLLSEIVGQLRSYDFFSDEVDAISNDLSAVQSIWKETQKRATQKQAESTNLLACGLLAVRCGEFRIADECFGRLQHARNQVDIYVTWGIQLMLADEPRRAVTVFEKALELADIQELKVSLQYYLAGALQLCGETESALRLAREAAQRPGKMAEISLRPAWVLYSANRLGDAESAYQNWLETNGKDYALPSTREAAREARFALSNICLKDSRSDEAIEWLEQILDEYPEDPGALNDLGYLLVDLGRDVERATEMIRRAVSAEPENVAYRDSLGWALYRSGEFNQAVDELESAVSVDEPDPIILDHLADALAALGKRKEAIQRWQQALTILSRVEVEEPLSDVQQRSKLKQSIEKKLVKNTVESN